MFLEPWCKHLLIKYFVKYSTVILLCIFAEGLFAACGPNTLANECCRVFISGIQSNNLSTGGSVTFTCGSQSLNNPSTQLPIATVNNPASCPSPLTCGTANCSLNTTCPRGGSIVAVNKTSSGVNGALTINSATPTSVPPGQYTTVTIQGNRTANFDGVGEYRITTLVLQSNSILNVNGGNDYFVATLNVQGTNTLNVTGTGIARFFIGFNGTAPNITQALNWNTGAGSSPDKLFLYFVSNLVTLNNGNTRIQAYIFGNTNFAFTRTALTGSPPGILGAVNGIFSIGMGSGGSDAIVTYDSTNLGNLTTANMGPSVTCKGPPATNLVVTGAPPSATYCSPFTISVTATRCNGDTDLNFVDKIHLDANNGTCPAGTNCFGTWAIVTGGGGPLSNVGNGSADYQFVAADQGNAQFSFTYPGNGLSNPPIKISDVTNAAVGPASFTVPFNPSQLLLTSTSVSGTPFPAAYNVAQTAGTNFSPNIIVTAVNGSCTSNVVTTGYTGAKTIKYWSTYVNPNTGTKSVTINGTPIGTTSGTATNISTTFSSGVATLSNVNYQDVGKILINAQDITTASITGATGNIVVKPAQFVIVSPSSFVPSNPAASNSSGPVFVKAGQAFQFDVQAQSSTGTLTPNYNLEQAPDGPQGILISPVSVSGGGTILGTIAVSTPFANVSPAGTMRGSVNYSEVGIINLAASVGTGSYLGAGNVSTTLLTNVGRFYPANFLVALAAGNTPQFTAACTSGGASNSYTYLGQPINYNTQPNVLVTARSVANTTTQNYTGSYKKLSASSFSGGNQNYISATGQPTLTVNGTLPLPTEVDNGNGTINYTFSTNSLLSYTHSASTDVSPFNGAIQLQLTVQDSDGVAFATNPFTVGSINPGTGIAFSNNAQMYQGRLFVYNVSGSQLLPMTIPMEAQFYTGTGYAVNTKDSCTTFNGAGVFLLTDPPFGTPITTTASLPSGPPYTFTAGKGNFSLSAPVGGATGQKNIEINLSPAGANMTWLQYNWPYITGTALENPRAQANFGFYPGVSPKIIYRRERY